MKIIFGTERRQGNGKSGSVKLRNRVGEKRERVRETMKGNIEDKALFKRRKQSWAN
jgi:hypothetical protein